jgi:hypothetical protein
MVQGSAERPLTQLDLNSMMCSDPECTDPSHELYFHSRCHPTRPVEAMYSKASGQLKITCAVCNRLIGYIAVEGGENPMSEVTKDPKEEPEDAEEGEEGEGGEDEGEGDEPETEAPASN